MKYFTTTLLISLLSSSFLFAQYKGEVKLSNDTTLFGYIKYYPYSSSKIVFYKKTAQSEYQIYSVNDLKSFSVKTKRYQRAIVQLKSNSANQKNSDSLVSPELSIDTCFLEELFNGNISLLKFPSTKETIRFYIKNHLGKTELLTPKDYKNQLFNYFKHPEELTITTKNLKYNEQSLIKFFKKNAIKKTKKIAKIVRIREYKNAFTIIGGKSNTTLNVSTTKTEIFTSDPMWKNGVTFPVSSNKIFGIGINFKQSIIKKTHLTFNSQFLFSEYGGEVLKQIDHRSESLQVRCQQFRSNFAIQLRIPFSKQVTLFSNLGGVFSMRLKNSNFIITNIQTSSIINQRRNELTGDDLLFSSGHFFGLGINVWRMSFEVRTEKGIGFASKLNAYTKTDLKRINFLIGYTIN